MRSRDDSVGVPYLSVSSTMKCVILVTKSGSMVNILNVAEVPFVLFVYLVLRTLRPVRC